MIDLLAAGAFCLLTAAEFVWPRRLSAGAASERWLGNGAVFVVNSLLALALASSLVGVESRDTGWMIWAAGLLFLDLLSYGLHRLSHAVPLLWRLHRLHHTDVDLDVTTALRHHPLEFVALLLATTALASLAGVAGEIVAAYGALSLACQMLQHANVRLPHPVELIAGLVLVTPDFHAVHHSPDRDLHDRNFGTVLSLWDRLLGTTAIAEPRHFGLAEFADPRYQRPTGMLLTPFA